jgi:flagellar basal body-associated protein FliL
MPPADPYGTPVSGGPYAPPSSGAPYLPPTSGGGYPQPGYPGQPYPTQPLPTQGLPAPGYPQQPGYPEPYPGFAPGYPPAAPPKKKRGLMITLILVAALVLCGGGGTAAYFVLNNLDGKGQATPTDAVTGFLKAVYEEKDVDKASTFVCKDARDKGKLTRKINELKEYEAKYNKSPKFSWPAPKIESQNQNTAVLTVKIQFSTSDDRVAESKLKIVTINKSGWWVCDIKEAT